MKTYLKNIISGAALGLALLPHPMPTWAGTAVVAEVFVGKTVAKGAVASARRSGDTKQFIGCSTVNQPGNRSADCYATDKNGASFSCYTYDPNLVAVADAITDYSYVSFSANAGSSTTCNSIYIGNASLYLP